MLLAKGLLLLKLHETLRPYVVRTLTEIPEGSPFELITVLIVTIGSAASIGLVVHFFIEWLLP